MKIPHNAHVALVDGTRFLVLRNSGQPFEPSLQLVAEPDLDPTNFSAGIRNQEPSAPGGASTNLNELAHGAAAAEWLNSKAKAGEIEHLVVVADPKTLGEMRRHYHVELKDRLAGELAKSLTGEPIPSIEKVLAAA
ncbi:attachment protein [Croceibacterium mercuriale]|uniref:Attachment protein n=1 Tax=Croceibacterium mercuriale TaxID=1572751 RepID=A0A0B2BTG3_9SPHN|nr:host attachment protein [Croceibacterium mercuriale]KHL24853.1 attachment protein [Croceibacterium mercuriale]